MLRFILAGISLITMLSASPNRIDSLRAYVDTTNGLKKGWALVELSKEIYLMSPAKALGYAREAQKIALLENDDQLEMWGEFYIGTSLAIMGKTESAYELLSSTLTKFKEYNDVDGIVYSFNTLAIIHGTIGNYQRAVEYLWDAAELFDKVNNKTLIPKVENNIADINCELGFYQIAKTYYKQALQNSRDIDNCSGEAYALSGLAGIYSVEEKYDSAYALEKEAYTIWQESESRIGLVTSLISQGKYLRKMNRLDDAEQVIQDAITIANEMNVGHQMVDARIELGELFNQRKEYTKAKKQYEEALMYSDRMNYADGLLLLYEDLAETNAKTNNIKNAYENLKLHMQMHDSLFHLKTNSRMTLLSAIYESEKKELEIAYLKEQNTANEVEIKSQRTQRSLIIGIAILLLVTAIIIYNRYVIKTRANNKIVAQQKALSESEEKYRELFEKANDLIYTIDFDGRYTDVNNAIVEELGYSKEECLQLNFRDVVSDRSIPVLEEKMLNKISGEEITSSYEIELIRKDRSKITVENKTNLIYKNGKAVGIQGIARNVTQRKKAEEALMEANASKDKFFSIIAHDLKSPLSALLGYSEIIVDDIDEMQKNEVKEFALNINTVAGSINALLENLLEWSRVQTGSIKYQPQPILLNDIVEKNIALFNVTAKAKKIRLTADLDGMIKVKADENMLNTILRNLTSNALKFTGREGRVTISVDRQNNYARISVEDTGVGIKEEDIDKLFKIDSQFSTEGTNNEQGTGLGLILCYELVKKNGGDMYVASELDEGSTFSFTIPLINN